MTEACVLCYWQQYAELSAKKVRQAIKHAVVQRDVSRIEAELREKETGLQNIRVWYSTESINRAFVYLVCESKTWR